MGQVNPISLIFTTSNGKMMNKPITTILFGAGQRGEEVYGRYALTHPDELKFVAVADPDTIRRERFAAAHNIPANLRFQSWEDALKHDKFADVVVNSTQDQMHYKSGMAALAAGYDMLLEKPMTHNVAQTVHLVQASEEHGRIMQVCHVLRYTPFFSKVYEILQSGRLGDIVTVEHRENVSYWHMAHSYREHNI